MVAGNGRAVFGNQLNAVITGNSSCIHKINCGALETAIYIPFIAVCPGGCVGKIYIGACRNGAGRFAETRRHAAYGINGDRFIVVPADAAAGFGNQLYGIIAN